MDKKRVNWFFLVIFLIILLNISLVKSASIDEQISGIDSQIIEGNKGISELQNLVTETRVSIGKGEVSQADGNQIIQEANNEMQKIKDQISALQTQRAELVKSKPTTQTSPESKSIPITTDGKTNAEIFAEELKTEIYNRLKAIHDESTKNQETLRWWQLFAKTKKAAGEVVEDAGISFIVWISGFIPTLLLLFIAPIFFALFMRGLMITAKAALESVKILSSFAFIPDWLGGKTKVILIIWFGIYYFIANIPLFIWTTPSNIMAWFLRYNVKFAWWFLDHVPRIGQTQGMAISIILFIVGLLIPLSIIGYLLYRGTEFFKKTVQGTTEQKNEKIKDKLARGLGVIKAAGEAEKEVFNDDIGWDDFIPKRLRG